MSEGDVQPPKMVVAEAHDIGEVNGRGVRAATDLNG